jgi:hypothetical protein
MHHLSFCHLPPTYNHCSYYNCLLPPLFTVGPLNSLNATIINCTQSRNAKNPQWLATPTTCWPTWTSSVSTTSQRRRPRLQRPPPNPQLRRTSPPTTMTTRSATCKPSSPQRPSLLPALAPHACRAQPRALQRNRQSVLNIRLLLPAPRAVVPAVRIG